MLRIIAAKAIGSEELEKKFNDALECLERPNSVAFAASLVGAILHLRVTLNVVADSVILACSIFKRL
jgi:N-dimethylarginine dimethylaminohydrolase